MASLWSKLTTLGRAKGLRRYRVLEPVSEGGFAQVYRAEDRLTNEVVALKVLKPTALKSARRLQRKFHRSEGEIAMSFQHENIVRTFDSALNDKSGYLAMEYIEGPNLRDVIFECEPLPRRRRLELITAMGAGLAYIHDQNYLHRDFCPKNILVNSQGVPKIIDFGLCIPIDRKLRWKWDRSGTPSYMAPEQVRGQSVDVRADIYAFGVSMFEVLALRRPFGEGASMEGRMQFHLNFRPTPPSDCDAQIPPALDDICLKAMAKDCQQRQKTMNEVMSQLRAAAACLQGQPGWE